MFLYWAHFVTCIIIFTYKIIEYNKVSSDQIIDAISDYENCVKLNGDDEDCDLDVKVVSFWLLYLFHIIMNTFPISTFIVFGARKEIFLFWKEYFISSWKKKRLQLQFIPSFDPSVMVSSSTVSDGIDEEARITRRNTRIKKIVDNEL